MGSSDASVRLSIVVPTLGRPTLGRTLASIAPQLGADDEVILVADLNGDADGAARALVGFGDTRWRIARCGCAAPGVGNAQRQHGIGLARGTHLLFMDDDDVYTPVALGLLRAAASDVPAIFRMDATRVDLGVLWADPALTYANVGTPMFVVPNDPARLGEWAPHNEHGEGGDFTFIVGCCERMGEPVWREEIVATVRPGPRASTAPAPARSPRARQREIPMPGP